MFSPQNHHQDRRRIKRDWLGHPHEKRPSSPPTIYSRASYPTWMLGDVCWGSQLQMTFKSSCHLQPCRLPKVDAWGASVGGHDYKWPSSPPTTYSRAGYPSYTLEGHQLGVTTINGLQVLLSPAAMPVIQAGRWRGVSLGSRLQMTFKSSYHLQPYRLPKLDVGGTSVGDHNSNIAFKGSFKRLSNHIGTQRIS